MAKERSPEFPTDWHQQAYLEALEREALGYQRRIDELEGLPGSEKAREDAESGLAAAQAELKRLGRGQAPAEKRPRESAKKETRGKK